MAQENIPVAKPAEEVSEPPLQAKSSSNRALAVLILGILSLICMGFFAGIPAIILGSMELRAIKEGKAPKEGEGPTKVGFILGIVSTVLTLLAMLALAAIIVLGIYFGKMEGGQGTMTSI